MALDFAFLQTGFLLPDEKDNAVFTPSEQERITRARRRRPRKEIIEEGLFPRRRGGARLPINRQSFNKESAKFVQQRLDTFLPDMSKTAKANLNRALRKSFDNASELGLTGRELENFIRKDISKVIGKKEPYSYLIESINKFINQDELISYMKRCGFKSCSYRNLSGGIVAVHSGWKI